MDPRITLETGVITAGCMIVGTYLQEVTTQLFHLYCLGFCGCSFVLVLLHQLMPQFYPELKRKEEQRKLYRFGADPGIWCCVMLPLSHVMYGISAGSLPVIETSFLLFTVPLTLVHFNPSNLTQLMGALSLLWLRTHLLECDVFSLILFGIFCIIYYMLLQKLPLLLCQSFTEGEITVVLQLFLTVVFSLTLRAVKGDIDLSDDLVPTSQKLSVVAFEGVLMASVKYWMVRRLTVGSTTVLFYLVYLTTTVTVVLPLLYQAFGPGLLMAIADFVTLTSTRTKLLCSWTVLVGTSVLIVYMRNAYSAGSVSSGERKVFHLVMLAVYIPGLLLDPQFLSAASVIALGVMVILETMRINYVWPLGNLLKSNYKVFTDGQDQGEVILTPLYLLIGMFLPLWIIPTEKLNSSDLRLYAGVLSLGVGDTLASLGGGCLGKHRWPGSKKTLEGTCISIAAQLVMLYSLHRLGVAVMVWPSVQAVILTSLLEAFTIQIDNLVLPLYMFCLLSVVPTVQT